jgi:hypothetical protein
MNGWLETILKEVVPEFIGGTEDRDNWCPEQDLKLRPLKYESRA